MSNFGLILREILARKNFTQRAAAEALGMDQSTVSYYCRSKNPPRPHVLAHMAAALGVSEAELLGQAGRVAETGGVYKTAAVADQRVIWMDRLRAEYRREPDAIATMVRAAWPKTMAEEIIAWLGEKK